MVESKELHVNEGRGGGGEEDGPILSDLYKFFFPSYCAYFDIYLRTVVYRYPSLTVVYR